MNTLRRPIDKPMQMVTPMKNNAVNAFLMQIIILACITVSPSWAQQDIEESEEMSLSMTLDRLDELIKRIDDEAERNGNQWMFSYEEMQVLVVTDAQADRMRVMTPVVAVDAVDEKQLFRLMQANFDSALDARYAIAQDVLWSTFIHPLSPLTDEQFFSGVGQTLTLVTTYGTTYSSGALLFGGGDSAEPEAPYDDIIKRGEST
ncbi:MAG: hypothetical protein AAF438_13780 [Pseudomonadota bacterium]